jgi:hypothetical protein
MKRWVTIIQAIDVSDPNGGIKTWVGPYVEAENIETAKAYCKKNLGYCKVTGELVGEIPEVMGECARFLLNDN